MTRKCALLLLLFCLTVSFASAQDAAECTPASGDPLRIGTVFSSAALLSSSAVQPYQGVITMVDALNACGGVGGHPVELVNIPANNRDTAREAVSKLKGDVPLIIGSGSPAVSEVLLEESRQGDFIYWEVSESLDAPHQWSFSSLPTDSQLGSQTADFIQSSVTSLLDKTPLRLAIVHEKRPAAQAVVDALIVSLSTPPTLIYAYDNVLTDGYAVAKQMREKKVNVMVIVAFDRDSDQMWLSMRQADANVLAYIQVGSEPTRRNACNRIGNSDHLVTITRTGAVSDAYRQQYIGAVDEHYTAAYMKQFALLPDAAADLSASSVYLLLHDLLPQTANDFTVSNIQRILQSAQLPTSSGIMGEGFQLDNTSFINQSAVAIVQQRQDNRFCSLFPSEIATCSADLQPFPTWRERVSLPEFASCVD
jgi:ABC-type branched-subunit amino acid transport system substrate-binding protein